MTTTTTPTSDARIAKLFGLDGQNWMRHANPVSVWTRFAVLPLLALAIWSRAWIGWWSLIPIALAVGLLLLAYGLIVLGPPGLLYVIAGIVIVQCAKAWFIDRMVLLFEDMKTRNPEYAGWEYQK